MIKVPTQFWHFIFQTTIPYLTSNQIFKSIGPNLVALMTEAMDNQQIFEHCMLCFASLYKKPFQNMDEVSKLVSLSDIAFSYICTSPHIKSYLPLFIEQHCKAVRESTKLVRESCIVRNILRIASSQQIQLHNNIYGPPLRDACVACEECFLSEQCKKKLQVCLNNLNTTESALNWKSSSKSINNMYSSALNVMSGLKK